MKKFIILISGSILLLLPKYYSNGCSYFPMGEELRIYLLQPGISERDELDAFYFSSEYLSFGLHQNNNAEEATLAEWATYFKNKYSKECLKTLIYNTDINCIFTNDCTDTALATCPGLRKEITNTTPAGKYLYYMHECLGLLNDMSDPWTPENYKIDSAAFGRMIKKGKKLLDEFKNDPYLQKRTAFNLIRLYYYFEDGKSLAEVYNSFFSPKEQTSSIDGSAYFYYTETAHNDNEYDYILSRVYDVSVEKKRRCVELFRRANIEKTLGYAKNNHEKAVIYSMWLLQYPGQGLDMLEKIYQLEPGFEDFDILLSRELNKLEDWLLTDKITEYGASNNYRNENDKERDYSVEYAVIQRKNLTKDLAYTGRVIAFTNKLLQANKFKKKALLHLYLTHLHMLKNEPAKAGYHNKQAARLSAADKNTVYALQLDINSIVLNFLEKGQLDETEKKLIYNFHTKIQHSKNPHDIFLEKNLLQFVGTLLTDKGEAGWGALLINKSLDYNINEEYWYYSGWGFNIGDYYNIYHYIALKATPTDMDTIIRVIDKGKHTPFEKWILTQEHRDEYDTDTPYYYPLNIDRNRVLDFYARIFVRDDKLETALTFLNKIHPRYWKRGNYPYPEFAARNPFVLSPGYSDEHSNERGTYIFPEILTDILKIKKQVAANHPRKDSLYFLLGNVYYNMTWHGNYWITQNYYQSRFDFPERKRLKLPNEFYLNYYGCTKAQKWYDLAYKTAKTEDLATMAYVMADQCRYNYFLTINGEDAKTKYLANNHLFKADMKKRFKLKNPEEKLINYQCPGWEDYFYNFGRDFSRNRYATSYLEANK